METKISSANPDIYNFDSLWDYNNPSETEKKFRKILPKVKDTNNTPSYLELLTQIARTLGLQMKFDEAHLILNEVEKSLNNEYPVAEIRYYLERGRVYNSSKQKQKSKNLFLEAYKLANENNQDFYAIDAAHMMGIIEEPKEALRWNQKAIVQAENSDDDKSKKWLGSLYNNSAWTYHDTGKYDDAIELFEKNVIWHSERKTERGLIIAKWSVARTLRSMNRIDEALERQLLILNEIEEKKLEPDGYVYEELGECYLANGNTNAAGPYFKLAFEILSKDIWLAEYEKERVERLKKLASVVD